MDVQDLLHRKVDIVTEASLHPAFRQRVLREARPLYQRADQRNRPLTASSLVSSVFESKRLVHLIRIVEGPNTDKHRARTVQSTRRTAP